MIISLGLLGLIFGSFINALVWRTKTKKSIMHGRSMCVHCHHELSWADLIPVLSWLFLRGRCRYCHGPISIQYPLVELATGGLFILSYLAWPRELVGPYEAVYFGLWLIASILLVAMAVYDLKWMQLPDKFNWPFVLSGLMGVAVLSQIDISSVADYLIGLAAAWAFFAGLYFMSKGRWLGGGDVKFALGLGLWLGWPKVVVGLMLAFYSASAVILPLLLLGVLSRRQPVPFGPFLIIGTIFGLLYGQMLIDWYQQTFLFGF